MNEMIFIHEDFFKMIELIPKENIFATNKTIQELPEVEKLNNSFTSCTVLPSTIIKLEDQKIPLKKTRTILETKAISFHDKISSGYSTTVNSIDNTLAWGFERYGVFVEYVNNTTKSIWLCNSAKFSSDNSARMLTKAILELAIELELILVDWNRQIVIDITKEMILKNYLTNILRFKVTD